MNPYLKKLYPESIKALQESPFHFEKREKATHTLKAYNPICGDRFELYISPQQQMVSEVHFHGFGCAISMASTSVLTKTLHGKSFKEASQACDSFLHFIDHGISASGPTLPDDFKIFLGARDFPERHDCATLSWKEMKKFLESKTNET